MLVEKLAQKLREYQTQFNLPEAVFDADASQSAEVEAIMAAHVLGPLFLEYESALKQLEREVRSKTVQSQKQAEEIRGLTAENEELGARLEVQQREYLKLVEETRDNADLLAMRTGALKGEGGADEAQELRERVHLLTEENHVLFEQVTLLRAHYDKYNEEVAAKVSEAAAKAQAFDLLEREFAALAAERDQLGQAKGLLEAKVRETAQVLVLLEEERKQDQAEMARMREQLALFQREYSFYKEAAERLETRGATELDQLQRQLRDQQELVKDLKAQAAALEAENAGLAG